MMNPAIRTATWVTCTYRNEFDQMERREHLPEYNAFPMDSAYSWARVRIQDPEVSYVVVFAKFWPDSTQEVIRKKRAV